MGPKPPHRPARVHTARVPTREMLQATKAAPSATADSLVVIYAPSPGDVTRRFVLDRKREGYDIGRASACDITVESAAASRQHARVERVEQGWAVRDVGSTNGTWVNDTRVERRQLLSHGDRIQVGEVILKHLSGDDVEAAFAEAIRLALVTDGLTQAANDRAFREALHLAVLRGHEQGTPVSLVIADLDHFKAVNDKHGHSAGDRVLREFVRVVRGVCDPQVQIARVGGEEFGLLLVPGTRLEALALAERARAAVEAHAFSTPSGTLAVTASFGVAQLAGPTEDGTALFARADGQL
jgi:two-component system, cell cycle response regulator